MTDLRDAREVGDVDVVIVGSGFGGSVTALRLAEKGYTVAVIEAGRRFAKDDLPKTSWDLKRYLWAPLLGCRGIQRITWLKDVLVLSGAGVGGGSLVYANTLYEPLPGFYTDPQWSAITDWEDELAPHYAQAKRMLGVTTNPTHTPADEVMRRTAASMGVEDTFRPTPVGVFFGQPGRRVADPYFGGAGPEKTGCIECGACMTGCRVGAKNTLDTSYLHLAQGLGAKVLPDTTVVDVTPSGSGYELTVRPTGPQGAVPGSRRKIRAEHVVFAAGALGTQRLLHRLRDEGRLPHLSERLGQLTRTNSESIVGAEAHQGAKGLDGEPADYTRGVAITSSFHPDEHTHIEPCRYGPGSNAMGMLTTLMTDGLAPGEPGARRRRAGRWLRAAVKHPAELARSLSVHRWSQRTVIALTMQSLDNSIRLSRRTLGPLSWLTSSYGHGAPNPTWIPAANTAARTMAKEMGGDARGSWGEVVNVPITAHIIGGCAIGATAADGVIDPYHRVHRYPGLHVVDGSAISANLGVNPSLTITAQAERAASLWPNKGEADPRPAPGSPYERLEAVAPRHPAVPAEAPGALVTLSTK